RPGSYPCCFSIAYGTRKTLKIHALQILGAGLGRAKVEFYLFNRASEILREHFGVFKFWNDWQSVVGPNIHASIGGEPERHSVLEFPFGLLFTIDEKPAGAAGGELPGFISGELVTHIHFALGHPIA